jgi:hypothetical protein
MPKCGSRVADTCPRSTFMTFSVLTTQMKAERRGPIAWPTKSRVSVIAFPGQTDDRRSPACRTWRFAARLPGLAFGVALAVRPAGAGSLRRSRAGPEDRFCEAVRNDQVPLTRRGQPGQCAAFRPLTWL